MESREDIDIKSRCALCKSMPCCPEHCCNWDDCKCSDCEYCRANQKAEGAHGHSDPNILIKASGQEQVTKLNTKKKAQSKSQKEEDEMETKPQEQIKAEDGALITNFEVNVEEEPLYAGGVKGIRALRQQRDQFADESQESYEESKHQYKKYEESKK